MSLRGARTGGGRMSGERGASAVEAAIVTPMVMAMLFGIIELGFLFKDYLAVAGAVRAGVRMASANPRTSTFAQVAADKVAATGGAMNLNDVQQMWVYKVDTTTDKPIGFTSFADCTVCVKFRWDTGTNAFVPMSDTWPASTPERLQLQQPRRPARPDRCLPPAQARRLHRARVQHRQHLGGQHHDARTDASSCGVPMTTDPGALATFRAGRSRRKAATSR